MSCGNNNLQEGRNSWYDGANFANGGARLSASRAGCATRDFGRYLRQVFNMFLYIAELFHGMTPAVLHMLRI